MQIPDGLNFQHIFVQAMFIVTPVILHQWWRDRTKRKEEEKRDERMTFVLKEYRPHAHKEETGTLHAENIAFPRSLNGK